MTKAISVVHWPGQDTPACEEHEAKLKSLAQFMGFAVTSTPNIDEDATCKNCENEAKSRS